MHHTTKPSTHTHNAPPTHTYAHTQERDPVERVRKLLLAHGADAGEVKALEKAVKKEVDSAVEGAKVMMTNIGDVDWVLTGL